MATFACTLVSFSFMYANRTYMINVSALCDTRNFGNFHQILKINIHIFEQIISPFFINETNNNVCMYNTKYIIFEMNGLSESLLEMSYQPRKRKYFISVSTYSYINQGLLWYLEFSLLGATGF